MFNKSDLENLDSDKLAKSMQKLLSNVEGVGV